MGCYFVGCDDDVGFYLGLVLYFGGECYGYVDVVM